MNTIDEQWALFAKMVLPKDAPPVQQQEMRRAFYAGAGSILRMQWEIGDAAVSEDAGVQIMEGWHDECRRFAQQVESGAA